MTNLIMFGPFKGTEQTRVALLGALFLATAAALQIVLAKKRTGEHSKKAPTTSPMFVSADKSKDYGRFWCATQVFNSAEISEAKL